MSLLEKIKEVNDEEKEREKKYIERYNSDLQDIISEIGELECPRCNVPLKFVVEERFFDLDIYLLYCEKCHGRIFIVKRDDGWIITNHSYGEDI